MEPDFPIPHGFRWQYDLIRFIQSWHISWLHPLLGAGTWLGVEGFYVVALPFVFWAVNKRLGLRLAYIFLCSMYLNSWLKDFFQIARPAGVPGIRFAHLSTASGYSMPSGHAQGTATFWVVVGRCLRRRWVWPLIALLLFLIGFSRVYFGLHWPLDVLVGWGIGLLVAIVGWWMGEWWTYRSFPFQVQMALALIIPAALLVLHNGPSAARYGSLLLGIGAGAVMEAKYLDVQLPSEWWRRACAVIIGMAGLIALQWLIKWPSDGFVWVLLRDGLTGLWGTLGAPWVFERCGLYQRAAATA
ncbi:MAG: phosphatase PAP2 family protein [Alicyclobacillus sp.]|nr:phosphatase PAP2 family protein [Alicyclobacillus sp.]